MENNFDRLRFGESFLPNSSRTRRLMKIHKDWFFLTREDVLPLGPFTCKNTALKAATDYAEFALKASPDMLDKLHTHLTFKS